MIHAPQKNPQPKKKKIQSKQTKEPPSSTKKLFNQKKKKTKTETEELTQKRFWTVSGSL